MLDLFMRFLAAVGALVARYPAVLDGIRLALAGIFFESCRRGLKELVAAISRASTMTVHIDIQDELYEWIMDWITSSPRFTALHDLDERSFAGNQEAKEGKFDLAPDSLRKLANRTSDTRGPARHGIGAIFVDLLEEVWPTGRAIPRALDIGVSGTVIPYYMHRQRERGRHSQSEDSPVLASPAKGKTMICDFQGHKVHITLSTGLDNAYTNDKGMRLSIFRGTLPIYAALVAHVREAYKLKSGNSLCIYTPGGNSSGSGKWGKIANRPLRPWDSVVLPRGMKEALLADATEFIEERSFYEERGLPWRRGYLLHGVPGAGKSSLIAALASKLGRGVYLVNLGSRDLDDSRLLSLLQSVPVKSVLVIEDVDCAFDNRKDAVMGTETEVTRSAAGDESTKRVREDSTSASEGFGIRGRGKATETPKSPVTLSGLLNALDGVATSEGRLLFCTTNYAERIDDALSRPGRCDVWLEFKNAASEQIYDLFMRFFDPNGTSRADGSLSASNAARMAHVKEKNDASFLSDDNLDDLAEQFVLGVPENAVSAAALQAYLMRYKRRPEEAVKGLKEWVQGGYKQGTREPGTISAAAAVNAKAVTPVNGQRGS